MISDRDRRIKENEDEARRIKEELVGLRETMFRHENALNVLAIERTNLESAPGEKEIEIPPELLAFVPAREMVMTPHVWPKVALGVLVFAGILIGLGALGIFDNDSDAPIAHRVVLPNPHVSVPTASKANEPASITSPFFPLIAKTNSTSNKTPVIPGEVPMNILPGITYTSEISYSMKSATTTLVEVSDTPIITLHLTHAPQSFLIPLRTPFRLDNAGIGSDQRNSSLMVFADSKKHDLEIRYESRKLQPERKILGVSSSQ